MASGKVAWGETPWARGRVAPPDIFGIGANYHAHAKELGRPPPVMPLVFPKATSSFNIGPFIVLPGKP
jgi:2-keto-4-pentenoate hydratase/2-oxohepta-3-ene-1,7-dioic acid hydratase in catechol pathway